MSEATAPRRHDLANVFGVLALVCFAFVLLTGAAMLLYSGGSHAAPKTASYSLTLNFFSDLGRERLFDGQINRVPRLLFTLALSLGGGGLGAFFLVFARLFRRSVGMRVFSLLGTAAGISSGLCFIGVGWTPADVVPIWHGTFVLWAFRLFLLAVVFFCLVMMLDRAYPRFGLLIFLLFAWLLVGYIWLLINGPSSETQSGLLVQVVGQKIIVYVALGVVGAQALVARHWLRRQDKSSAARLS